MIEGRPGHQSLIIGSESDDDSIRIMASARHPAARRQVCQVGTVGRDPTAFQEAHRQASRLRVSPESTLRMPVATEGSEQAGQGL
eukprot:764012-Hanusia_phi.AAC.5